MAFSIGTRLGRYLIQSPIGSGGTGDVYRACDTTLNRDLALKVLSDLLAGDAEQLGRFDREAQPLAALNHPHIAQIYGFEDLRPADGSQGTGLFDGGRPDDLSAGRGHGNTCVTERSAHVAWG